MPKQAESMSCLDGDFEKDMVVSLVVLCGWKRLVLWRELFWFTVCDRFSLHPTSCQWVRGAWLGSHIVVRGDDWISALCHLGVSDMTISHFEGSNRLCARSAIHVGTVCLSLVVVRVACLSVSCCWDVVSDVEACLSP